MAGSVSAGPFRRSVAPPGAVGLEETTLDRIVVAVGNDAHVSSTVARGGQDR